MTSDEVLARGRTAAIESRSHERHSPLNVEHRTGRLVAHGGHAEGRVREEWQRERDALLVARRKPRALDGIAARRRRLPMVRFDNEKYRFATTDGPMGLSDFFEGRQQLALTSS